MITKTSLVIGEILVEQAEVLQAVHRLVYEIGADRIGTKTEKNAEIVHDLRLSSFNKDGNLNARLCETADTTLQESRSLLRLLLQPSKMKCKEIFSLPSYASGV